MSDIDHRTRHPKTDEATKDGLWRHLNSPAHLPSRMSGVQGHYTKPTLVEIHRGLHDREGKT